MFTGHVLFNMWFDKQYINNLPPKAYDRVSRTSMIAKKLRGVRTKVSRPWSTDCCHSLTWGLAALAKEGLLTAVRPTVEEAMQE